MPPEEVELGDRRPPVPPARDQGQQREVRRVPRRKSLGADDPRVSGQVHVAWAGPASTVRLQRQHIGRVADHLAAPDGGHDPVLVDRPDRAAGAERGHRGELDPGKLRGQQVPGPGQQAGQPPRVDLRRLDETVLRPAPPQPSGIDPARTGSGPGRGAGSAGRSATGLPRAPTGRRAGGRPRPGRWPVETSRRWSPSDPNVTPWWRGWYSPRPHPPGWRTLRSAGLFPEVVVSGVDETAVTADTVPELVEPPRPAQGRDGGGAARP